jgi:viroplasmin and RNaseH domain-containing protein
MEKRLLDDQKAFDKKLNARYDVCAKSALKEMLEQKNYKNVIIRKTEFKDIDKSYWDLRGNNEAGKTLYFDVEVKQFWTKGDTLPKKIQNEGFSFLNRKSASHNERQNKTDYLVYPV